MADGESTYSHEACGRPESLQSAAKLMELYYPLVCSVCRRYLRRSQDVEDAAQETFIKLLRHAGQVNDVRGWLTATAYSTSIDIIRRAGSRRRRQENLAHLPPDVEQRLIHQEIQAKLHEALLRLDDPARELLIERFVCKTPLRVIAGKESAAVGTISRRVTRAVSSLASILREMGVKSADDLTVAEHFGDPSNLATSGVCEDADLRFAPDWQASAFPLIPQRAVKERKLLPGWNRPLRLGAFISHLALTSPDLKGVAHPLHADGWRIREAWVQIGTLALMNHHAMDFVGIVERGSSGCGPVEGVLRDYELFGGLIEATDSEGLGTLDVILLGNNWVMAPPIAKALHAAVRDGVGLLNDCCWTDLFGYCDSNEDVRALALAESPTYRFHTKPVHETPMPVVVHEEHPVLPGLKPGMQPVVPSCGPVYQVARGARLLMSRNHVVPPEEHKLRGVGPLKPPLYVVGQLGKGRVAVVNVHAHHWIVNMPGLAPGYMDNLLAWLAHPRR